MKIVFFNRFFFPDTSATSQIVSDLAFHVARDGREVHVVTSRSKPGLPDRETIRGVCIHRVADAITGPHSLFERAAAYVSFYWGARRRTSQLVAPGDVCVVKTDPPMLSSAIGPVARRRGAKVIAWLQDVFPETAREYGIPGMRWPVGSALAALRDRSLRESDAIVVIGERMARRVAMATGPLPRLEVIHNWADGQAIRPVAPQDNGLRREWNPDGAFIVGYSGNLGRVHEFDTMLDAAARLRGDRSIRFLVVGRGPRLAEVRKRIEAEDLSNVVLEDHQPREKLAESLSVPDVHLCVLQPRFEGLVHPSKLYGIMASGRPTIVIGDRNGEAAAIVAAGDCGTAVASGDGSALAQAIVGMRDDEAGRLRMGVAAREAFERLYAMPLALRKWQDLLARLA